MADEATSVIRPLTRKRKVLFAVIATMLAFLLLEAAARAYSVVRFRNTAALWHGATLVQRLTSGEVEPALTNAGRLQQEQATDAIYERRTDRSLLPIRRGASVELNNGVPATVNSLGLRGPEISTTAAPNTVRIGVFGGSYVFGAYLTDEEAWPALLAKNLRLAGVNAEVLNAGVNGFNIHDVLETLIRLSHATRLDYVVVTSAYNNHSLLPMERTMSWARRLDFYLYNLSMLHVIMQEKLSRLRGEPIEFGLYSQRIRVEPSSVAEWLSMYRRRLDQIAMVCRETGATLVVASQPEKFYEARLNKLSTLDPGPVLEMSARINRGESLSRAELEFFMQSSLNIALKQFAEVRHVLFFDGASLLAGDIDRYLLDPVHPGEEGARRLAEVLSVYFRELFRSHAATP